MRTLVPNEMLANPAVSILSAPNTAGPLSIATNATLSGNLAMLEAAKPANPAAGQIKLYAKADHKIYILDPTGLETDLTFQGMTQAEGDARYPLKTDTDPYPVYLTQAEGDARYSPSVGGGYLPLSGGTINGDLAVTGKETIGTGGTLLTLGQAASGAFVAPALSGSLTLSAGGSKSWNIDFSTGGSLLPQVDNTMDVGSSSKRVKTVYAGVNVDTPQVGTSSTTSLSFATNGLSRWVVGGSDGVFGAITDNTLDIGYAANSRPRDLNLGRSLIVGGASGMRLRAEPNMATAWNLEQNPTGATNFLPSNSGSYGAGLWLTANAYFDGTNFQAYNTSTATTYLNISASGIGYAYAPATTNPVTGFTWPWSVDTVGRVTQSGGLWIDSGGTWDGPSVSMTTAALFFGGGPTATGEGIGSKRTAGGNQFGLDFFVGWATRMSVSTGGVSVAVPLTANSGQTTYGHTMMSQATGGIGDANPSQGQLELQNAGGGASKIAFHRTGAYAAYLGLDTDNVWAVGGWSMGGARYRILLGDNFSNGGGQITVGQVNSPYINTEGVDIGAGPLYFKHNASYYINWDGGGWFQTINMGVMSWNNFAFSANAGIWIGGWDGTYIHTSHSIAMNGSTLIFSNNGGVYWQWNGSNMYCPNNVQSGGYVMSGSTAFYLGTSGSYYISLSANVCQIVNMNLLSWGWVGFAGNGGINLSWDGTINATHTLKAPDFTARAGDNAFRHGDDNVRMIRPSGTNIWYCYAWDAQWAFIRTTDSHNCGYVDAGGFHNTSTIKVKQDVAPLRDGLKLVEDRRVTPIRFAYRGDAVHAPTPSVGFTAEDMAQVVPEAVGYDADGPVSINYSTLIPVLWDAVRTLNQRITELEAAAA